MFKNSEFLQRWCSCLVRLVQALNLSHSNEAPVITYLTETKENYLERECILNFSSGSLRVAMATSTPTLVNFFLNRRGSPFPVMK
jgi:hypothetical protein